MFIVEGKDWMGLLVNLHQLSSFFKILEFIFDFLYLEHAYT